MKSRFWIFILVLALVALAILFWRHPVQPAGNIEKIHQAVPASASPTETTNISPNAAPNAGASQISTNNVNISAATNLPPAELRNLQIKQAIEGMNVPISFYGRVIDQESNGLPGVVIVLHIMQPRVGIDFAIPKNMPKFERTTDANGYFSVEGISGSDLDIESVDKRGYRLSPKTEMGYRYGQSPVPFYPDPSKPVIIKMWKELETKESLVTGSHVFGIDSGKIYTLDLIQGKKFEGQANGDLRVSITRPIVINSKDRYPWSYSIEVISGGLVEASPDDEFMYLAPEAGYEPKLARVFDPADSDWNMEINKQFFIRTRDGRVYGRVQVSVYADYNVHSAIEVNYALNPNASRNLQP